MKELVEKVAALYADFSKDANAQIEKEGLTLMHLRKVPVNTDILGKDARSSSKGIPHSFS